MSVWLVDKSALWKLPRSPDRATWEDYIERGLVRATVTTWLEVAVSARDTGHWERLRADLVGPLLLVHATPRSEAVAVEISTSLVAAGLHRSVPVPDVLIASVAVAERLTVLHDDEDFARIREVYGPLDEERLRL